MAIIFGCTCGKPLRAKEESAGKRTKCPHCGALVTIPGGGAVKAGAAAAGGGANDPLAIDLAWPTIEAGSAVNLPAADVGGGSTLVKLDPVSPGVGSPGPHDDARAADRPRPADGTHQYKVLSGKDQGMTGKFNALKLEEALNDHARHGWSVKAAATIGITSHSGTHDELIVILER